MPLAFSFRWYWRRNWASAPFVWPCHSFLGHWRRQTPGWAFEGALNGGSPQLTSPCVRGCVCMHVHWSSVPLWGLGRMHISGFPLDSSSHMAQENGVSFCFFSPSISDIWAANALLKHCGCFIPKGRFCAVWWWLGAKKAELKVKLLWATCWKETSGDWQSRGQTEQKDAAAEALSTSVLPVYPDSWQRELR